MKKLLIFIGGLVFAHSIGCKPHPTDSSNRIPLNQDTRIEVIERNRRVARLVEAIGKSSNSKEQVQLTKELADLRRLHTSGTNPLSTPFFLPLDDQGMPIKWSDTDKKPVAKFLVHDPFNPELIPETFVVPQSNEVIEAVRDMLWGH